MDKKKVFKLATASTVAASAFLVAAPTQAAGYTVAQAEYLVNKAIKAQDSLRKQTTVYNANDAKLLAGAPVQINRLEKAIDNAKAAIGTLSKKHRVVLYAKLNDQKHGVQKLTLAQSLENGKNFDDAAKAATKVQAAKAAVQTKIDDASVAALEKAITDAQVAYGKVYGKFTRDSFRATHGTEVSKWLEAEKEKMTPKVASVSAINGMTIEVKFNKELNEGSAETIANYTANGAALNATAELQADKKTVVLSFTAANKLAQNTPVIMKIDNITTVDAKNVDTYEKIFTFSDSSAATLKSVEYPTNSSAKIWFSEPMGVITAADIKVFDGETEVAGSFLGASTAAGDTSLTLDTSSLSVNKVYTVKIYNAKDIYGNFGGTLTTTISKTTQDTVLPEVTSVEGLSLDTVKINFSEKVISDAVTVANGYGTLSIGGLTNEAIVAGSTNIDTVTRSVDGKSLTIKLTAAGKTAAGLTADGLKTVSVNNFLDASKNKQTTAWTKVVNFAADTTAPTVSKSEVVGNKLYVTFNEDISVVAGTTDDFSAVKYVKNNVEYSPSAVSEAFTAYDPDGDGVTKTIVLDLGALSYVEGNYTVTLASSVVADPASVGNAATTLTFNYVPTASTDKPKVTDSDTNAANGTTGIVQAGNVFTVTFDKDVDATTALNLGNYLVDGQPVFSNAIFVGNERTVRLTAKPDAIKATASYLFTVQNVKSKAGVAMDSVVYTQSLQENVAPVIKTAVLTAANTVSLTFSETVTGVDAADFELYLDGVKVGATTGVSGSGTSYAVTLPSALTAGDLNKNIQLKVVSGAAIKDNADSAAATGDISLVEGGFVTVSK